MPKGILPQGILPQGFGFWSGAFLVALFMPLVIGGIGFVSDSAQMMVYVAVNLMWILVLGTAGIFSFATLAIVGVSGYAGAYLSVRHGLPWPAMMAVGVALGAFAGLLIAVPAIRLRGVYFALFTFGLAELLRSYVTVTDALGGAPGLYGTSTFVPEEHIGTETGAVIAYYVAALLVVASLIVYRVVDGGRLGLLLRTARESEPFAQALGVDVVRARLTVFVGSSAMLGLAGAIQVCLYRGISPSIFRFDTLLLLFAMVVVGGLASARGVLFGTALLFFIAQHFLEAGPMRFVAVGAVMLAVTLFTTSGLAGVPAQVREWRERRSARLTGAGPARAPLDHQPIG